VVFSAQSDDLQRAYRFSGPHNTKKEKNQVISWLLDLVIALHKPWAPPTRGLRRISVAISVHSVQTRFSPELLIPNVPHQFTPFI
jgi:hypothetical protein